MTGAAPDSVRRVELAGVVWTVREVRPAATSSGAPRPLLVFDSGEEQRHLSPAPEGWPHWNDTQLQDACLLAITVRHHGVTFGRGSAA
jgi:hypothetical protein